MCFELLTCHIDDVSLVKDVERLTVVTLILPVACQQSFLVSVEVFICII